MAVPDSQSREPARGFLQRFGIGISEATNDRDCISGGAMKHAAMNVGADTAAAYAASVANLLTLASESSAANSNNAGCFSRKRLAAIAP